MATLVEATQERAEIIERPSAFDIAQAVVCCARRLLLPAADGRGR
jgi:hypothetical protein